MKLSFLWIPFLCALVSCGATQGVYQKTDGTLVRYQNTGVLNEADNFVMTQQAPDGTLLTIAATRIDNKAVVDSYWTGKSLLEGVRGLWSTQKTKVAGDAAAQLKGTVDPQAVPGSALGEAHVLGTVPGALKVVP